MNVWQIGPGVRETQLTHNPNGGVVSHRKAVIISSNGRIRQLRLGAAPGFYLSAWGGNAPAIAVNFADHAAQLVFPGGRRERLPGGWHLLAWNPDGGKLLVQSPFPGESSGSSLWLDPKQRAGHRDQPF